MSQSPPSLSAGQISPDGRLRWDGTQWVPTPVGQREPTPWTRPMQLGAAAVFLLSAVRSIATWLLFYNHDSVLKALQARGPVTTTPGISIDDLVTVQIAIALVIVIFYLVLDVIGVVGSVLGWRWMFWAALVLFGTGGLIKVFDAVPPLARPEASQFPVASWIATLLFGILNLAMFAWMLAGVIKYGPWAVRQPGVPR